MNTRVVGVVVGTVLLLAGIHGVLAQGYQISSPEETAVPERSVDFQGETYNLDTLIRADVGEQVTVSVTAPDRFYRANVYNSQGNIVESKAGDGSGTFSYTLSKSIYEPGSYMITTVEDGDYTAVQPLLIQGYEVGLTAPETVTTDETLSVDVTVTATASSGTPEIVQVAIIDQTTTETVTATQSDGTYTATIDASQLSAGEYSVYGVVRDSEEAFGENELVGMSDGTSIEVKIPSTPTPTTSPTPTPTTSPTPTPTMSPTPTPTPTAVPLNDSGPSSSDPSASTPTLTPVPTTAPPTVSPADTPVSPTDTPVSPTSPVPTPMSPTVTPQPTSPTATAIASTPTPTPETTTPTRTAATTPTPAPTPTASSGSVVTPNVSTATSPVPAETGPGFGPLLTLLALIAACALLVRRRP